MREIQLTDAHLISEVIAFRATSALGEGKFLIARVTDLAPEKRTP